MLVGLKSSSVGSGWNVIDSAHSYVITLDHA